jgi:hypothetical protein
MEPTYLVGSYPTGHTTFLGLAEIVLARRRYSLRWLIHFQDDKNVLLIRNIEGVCSRKKRGKVEAGDLVYIFVRFA